VIFWWDAQHYSHRDFLPGGLNPVVLFFNYGNIQKNTSSLIVCTKSIDRKAMNNSGPVPSEVAFRPEWKANLCLLFVVAVVVAASVLLFLPESSEMRGTNAIDIHQARATAIASRSER